MKSAKIYKINNKSEWLNEIKKLNKDSEKWIVLDTMPWGGDYKPLTLAAVSYSDSGINVYMRSYEKNIRFEGINRNDPVHLDSCLEFFFSPEKDNLSYLNFEINPVGSLYTGYSKTGLRKDSGPVLPELDPTYFDINALSKEEAYE